MAGAMGMIDTLSEFDSAVEPTGAPFDINEVAEENKVPMLGTLLGAKSYSLLRSLVAPENPKDKTYTELVVKLRSHIEPKPLDIAERFNFYRRTQATGESVVDFVGWYFSESSYPRQTGLWSQERSNPM